MASAIRFTKPYGIPGNVGPTGDVRNGRGPGLKKISNWMQMSAKLCALQ